MNLHRAALTATILGACLTGVGATVLIVRRRRGKTLGDVHERHVSRQGRVVRHLRDDRMTIDRRVQVIQDLVWRGINGPDLPELRKIALAITKDCPERDGRCEAEAIYHFVKKHVRYTGDIAPIKMGAAGPVESVDLFQSALRTLEYQGGDCDDHTILVTTLLALNGIQPKMEVSAPAPEADYGHIYPLAGVDSKMAPTKWIPLDTTLPGDGWFGKAAPHARSLRFDAARRARAIPA